MVLYGSRAKGTAHTGSDIDFRLDGAVLSLGGLDDQQAAIDDLLLPWKMDITVKQQIDNPDLKAHIERAGVRLFPN